MSDFSKLMQNEIKKIPRVPRLEWLCLTSMDNIYLNPEFLKVYLFIFRERWKEWEREGETSISCKPTTQACTLTGNQTNGLLIHRLALNPLSHTSQGWIQNFKWVIWGDAAWEKVMCSFVNHCIKIKSNLCFCWEYSSSTVSCNWLLPSGLSHVLNSEESDFNEGGQGREEQWGKIWTNVIGWK